MTVKYDTETEKWLKKNIIQQTTVMKCEKCGLYYKPSLGHKCENKEKYVPDNKVGNKKTNRDKLNEMSNEELAYLLYIHTHDCGNCLARVWCHSPEIDDKLKCDELIKLWLESEVE